MMWHVNFYMFWASLAHNQGFHKLYINDAMHRNKFFLNNQPDAVIIQIYSIIKLHMFRASSFPIIRSFPLYIRHW